MSNPRMVYLLPPHNFCILVHSGIVCEVKFFPSPYNFCTLVFVQSPYRRGARSTVIMSLSWGLLRMVLIPLPKQCFSFLLCLGWFRSYKRFFPPFILQMVSFLVPCYISMPRNSYYFNKVVYAKFVLPADAIQ